MNKKGNRICDSDSSGRSYTVHILSIEFVDSEYVPVDDSMEDDIADNSIVSEEEMEATPSRMVPIMSIKCEVLYLVSFSNDSVAKISKIYS